MTGEEARRRFAAATLAHLATADERAIPHVVPFVFVVRGETIYSAVDAKPKRTTALRRLANVAANPHVAALVDHYSEDWDSLWWARAEGLGRVLDATAPEARDALALLSDRYHQYRRQPPGGPILAIDVERWSGWSASID